jgi:hypothetical protein
MEKLDYMMNMNWLKNFQMSLAGKGGNDVAFWKEQKEACH